MARPIKCRKVEFFPKDTYFVPLGKPKCKIEEVVLKIEELEASFTKENPSEETLEKYNKTKEELDLALQEWEYLGTQLN